MRTQIIIYADKRVILFAILFSLFLTNNDNKKNLTRENKKTVLFMINIKHKRTLHSVYDLQMDSGKITIKKIV